MAAKDSTFEKVKKKIGTINLGMCESGPEILAHIARALVARGYAASTQDAIKAFHTLSRQALLDSIDAVWPEATKIFNAYYGPAAPSVYIFVGDNDNKVARVSFNTEGTRPGCVFGSLGFDVALHHFVYKHLCIEFPDIIMRALTDDMPNFICGQTDEEWHEQYESLADFLLRYDELANPIGVKRHPDKGKTWLPAHAPHPKEGCRLLGLTKIVPHGVAIAGGFFGTDNGVATHGIAKASCLQPRIDNIVQLATIKNAQASMRLLGIVANRGLDYLARITPPSLLEEALANFDSAIADARHLILQLEHCGDPGLPDNVFLRSTLLVELPQREGGFSQMPVTRLSPCAFIASVRATQGDPFLSKRINQHALLDHTVDAYARLADSLGAPPSSFPDMLKSIPRSAHALAKAPASPSTRLNKTKRKKIQAAIVTAVQGSVRKLLRRDTHPERIAPDVLTKGESVNYQIATSRSQATRILQGSLWYKSNRCVSDWFVHYTRFYLGLLPLLRTTCDHITQPDGSARNACAAGHDTTILLTPDASHCISCAACYGARHAAHELINNVYVDFGKEATLRVQINPSTDNAMKNVYGKTQASLLFPKRTTPATKEKSAELNKALEIMAGKNTALQPAALETIRRIAAECPKNFKGLRVDSIMQAKHFLLWLDVGIVHTTAPSTIDQTVRFVKQLAAAEVATGGNYSLDPLAGVLSPPLARYTKHKDNLYKPMVNAAIAQIKQGIRTLKPIFTPCIFSHMGEMSTIAVETVEVITKAYKASLSFRRFEDGISHKKRSAEFRARFKDALMVAIANGFGSTLAAAGLPVAGSRVVSAFDRGGLPPWEVSVS